MRYWGHWRADDVLDHRGADADRVAAEELAGFELLEARRVREKKKKKGREPVNRLRRAFMGITFSVEFWQWLVVCVTSFDQSIGTAGQTWDTPLKTICE